MFILTSKSVLRTLCSLDKIIFFSVLSSFSVKNDKRDEDTLKHWKLQNLNAGGPHLKLLFSFFYAFVPFLFFSGKNVKTLKEMISTSKWHAKLVGQNTQYGLNTSNKFKLSDFISAVNFELDNLGNIKNALKILRSKTYAKKFWGCWNGVHVREVCSRHLT